MFWFDWLIIGSIALLAGAAIGAWKQAGGYYWSKYILSAWKRSSTEATVASEAGVVTHRARAKRYATQESVAASVAGGRTQDRFMESLESEWRRSSHTGGHFCLAILDLDRFNQLNDRGGGGNAIKSWRKSPPCSVPDLGSPTSWRGTEAMSSRS
jgi:hypothetical protein